MLLPLVALLLAQPVPPRPQVADEGVVLGRPDRINFTGAGVTCAGNNAAVACDIPGGGGGGGSGLPADPAACPASQWVYDQNASGVLSCRQPGWTDIASKPSTFTPSAHTHPGSDVTSAVANATAAAGLSGTSGTPSTSTFLRGDWSWQAPPAQDWSVITGKPATFPATVPVSSASALAANGSNCTSGQAALGVDTVGAAEGCWTVQQPAATTALKAGTVGGAFADYAGSQCSAGQAPLGLTAAGAVTGCFTPPGTYALPDATAAVTGGVRLTGDFGGTATSPTVPALASRSGTGACGANTWASTLNGAAAPTCTQPAFSNLSGSLTLAQMPTGTGFLKAAGGTPTYQAIASADLPAATTALGAVKMAAACGAGNHISSIGAGGELTCSADTGAGGGYTTIANQASLLTQRSTLNFAGFGVSCADNAGATRTDCTVAGLQFADEASLLTQRGIINFTGAGVTCTDNAGSTRTDCSIPGTSGSTVLLGNGAGGFSNYAGTSCTNQFPRSLSTAGAATCAGVALADFVANLGTTTTVLHGNAAGQPSYSAVSLTADVSGILPAANGGTANGFLAFSGPATSTKTVTLPNSNLTVPTPVAGAVMYSSSTTAFAQTANATTGAALAGVAGGSPVWVAVQTCTSSASTTCTITVARSGCLPVCMNATAVSTWVRGTVATTTLTCTFSTSGTNTCNCFCP